MRIGVCVGIKDLDKIRSAKKAGFDYIETGFAGFANATDEERRAFCDVLAECDIKVEAMNGFITEKVVGDEYSEEKVKAYLDRAFALCCGMTDVKSVVFGSGAARKVPDGFPMEKALEQFRYVCRELVEPMCEKYGVNIAIENLQKKETNILNKDADVNAIANEIGCEHIKVLSDNYHMVLEEEPYSVIETFGNNLVHAHIANPEGRLYPMPTDTHDYKPFFAAMKKIGYDERVSVEAGLPEGMTNEEALPVCAAFLRKVIAEA